MNRWSEFEFKNGQTAKNRVVVPPMASQTADQNGFVTAKTLEHYRNLGLSGAGLIFVEYSFVHQSGKGEENQLGVYLDEQVEGLSQISDLLHQAGALAGLQIVHVGGKTSKEVTGQSLIGASSQAVPVKDRIMEKPCEASQDQIEQMIDWYVESSRRAVAAGFDVIELHAAHGYGLNQWLSPITNNRSDQYGGNIYGRSLLLRSLVERIKAFFPDVLLAVRLPAQDHLEGGLRVEDMQWLVKTLETLKVDLIDVSSGLGGWKRPKGKMGQGYLVADAELLKSAVELPVIGVGGIKDGDYIDLALKEQKIDFTAVGRAILKNPGLWRAVNLSSKGKIQL